MQVTDKFGQIKLKSVLDTFVPLFVLEHNWNVDDKFENVAESKRKYLHNLLLERCEQGSLNGEIKTYDVDTPHGYDEIIDMDETSFSIDETFKLLFGILLKNGSSVMSKYMGAEAAGKIECEHVADIDDETQKRVDEMSIPELKKKVKELSNEKVKWDKSIEAACQVGILFFEKGIAKQATEKVFIDEFNQYFSGLPKKTISMIYKALPCEYRNTGGSPAKEAMGIDDDAVDTIIEASTFAGYLTHKEGVDVLEELQERLAEDEYEIPPDTYLKAIAGACKKVTRKYS